MSTKKFALQLRTAKNYIRADVSEWQTIETYENAGLERHVWGYIKTLPDSDDMDDTHVIITNTHFRDDMTLFEHYILTPIAQALALKGFTFDAGDIDYTPTLKDILQLRNDWYKSNEKHSFGMNHDNTMQFESVVNKKGKESRPWRACIYTFNYEDYIVNCDRLGTPKKNSHTWLDLFGLVKKQIERSIASNNAKGIVEVRLVPVLAVSVTGQA